jgi:hypothetical protein
MEDGKKRRKQGSAYLLRLDCFYVILKSSFIQMSKIKKCIKPGQFKEDKAL